MDMVPDDKVQGLKTPIWDVYKKTVNEAEGKEVMPSCYVPHHSHLMYLN